MKLTIPKAITACGVLGGGGAIAPTLMSAATQSEEKESSSTVRVGPQLASQEGLESAQLKIVKCADQSNLSGAVVDYGDSSSKDICWTVESSGEEMNEEDKYTNLFLKTWGSRNGNWSTAQSDWKSLCMQGEDKWVFASVGEGKEYLGLCSSSVSSSDQVWISIEGKDSSKLSIQHCKGDCWKREETGSPRQLKEKSGNWKNFQFRTQNILESAS
ncbi:hypothetical protein [Candidatus Mycoplasma haematominutum]|uniref:Uncharacterized protein n=1 Tax=Candidatus Mycoplasma haematominutum 'Birmingham 1' TaxID=1116213 RepID=G8C3Q2_9MOLU|nr:hypothetical protein [Candidatus Mycoplasma haematominutum]CCE66950.1 hypothetical protein MHM_04320 [Candidatus Mycoplasma haematominutum 'Birmingham 1']